MALTEDQGRAYMHKLLGAMLGAGDSDLFHEIIMSKSRDLGMRTFDWALFELYNDGHIAYEAAIRSADSLNELRLDIKLKSTRGEPELAKQAQKKRELEDEELAKLRTKKAAGAV